jgi:predicted DNA-binding ribbon-helix-helix protein
MSLRELDIISRQFKSDRDATLIRKDVTMYQKDLTKEAMPFISEVDKIAKKEKCNNVTLIAVIYDQSRSKS